MGTAKTIHSYAAIVFTLAVLVAGHLDVHRQPLRALGQVHPGRPAPAARAASRPSSTTSSRLRKPPGFVGHNPLAGLTYTLVFFLYFTMIATGLALRTVSADVHSPLRIFSFLLPLFGGPQTARWIHHVGMWLLWGFAVHHVYSAILMSQVEGNAHDRVDLLGLQVRPPRRRHLLGLPLPRPEGRAWLSPARLLVLGPRQRPVRRRRPRARPPSPGSTATGRRPTRRSSSTAARSASRSSRTSRTPRTPSSSTPSAPTRRPARSCG